MPAAYLRAPATPRLQVEPYFGGCTGKVAQSRTQAVAVIRRWAAAGHGRAHAYRCTGCGQWHTSHEAAPPRETRLVRKEGA